MSHFLELSADFLCELLILHSFGKRVKFGNFYFMVILDGEVNMTPPDFNVKGTLSQNISCLSYYCRFPDHFDINNTFQFPTITEIILLLCSNLVPVCIQKTVTVGSKKRNKGSLVLIFWIPSYVFFYDASFLSI